MRLPAGVLVAVLVVIPQASQAQAVPKEESHVFVDVNVAGASAPWAGPRQFVFPSLKFGEVATTRVSYPTPSQANAVSLTDVGVFVRLVRYYSAAVSYSMSRYANVLGLSATIPDPNFLNDPASATGATPRTVGRREDAIHASIAFMPIRTSTSQARFFLGPSLFLYSADMANNLIISQSSSAVSPQNAIEITGATTERVSGHAFGLHFGGEWVRFFTRRIGIAIGGRVDRGTVTLSREPLSTLSQKVRVGGARIFFGLRFRIGS